MHFASKAMLALCQRCASARPCNAKGAPVTSKNRLRRNLIRFPICRVPMGMPATAMPRQCLCCASAAPAQGQCNAKGRQRTLVFYISIETLMWMIELGIVL
eukprot:3499300-Pyramimonas_sp.AAC.1